MAASDAERTPSAHNIRGRAMSEPPSRSSSLFRDAVRRVAEERRRADDTSASDGRDGVRAGEGSGKLSTFWDVAREVRRRAASARRRQTRNRATVKPLPVFFDKDGRTGASAVWWRDAFAVSAALDGDGAKAESAVEESDLGHAARATLFFAQDMSRELLNDLEVATTSLSFWEMIRDRPSGQARFLLLNTGPRNFISLAKEGTYRLFCHARATVTGKETSFALPSASARVIIDGRVNALSELQLALASVVGRVHHHADIVANSFNPNAAELRDNSSREETRQIMIEATDGLLECLEEIREYSSKTMETLDDLAKVSAASKITLKDSPKVLRSLSRLGSGMMRTTTPDLPEPSPRSRSSVDFDSSPGGSPRPPSRLQRLASFDLSRLSEDTTVQHRFRQPLVIDGQALPLPKVNDGLWQALKRVENEWLEVRDASHDALYVHAKPPKHIRRWLLYTVGGITLALVTSTAVRHSRVCGRDDLDNLMQSVQTAISAFLKTRLFDPVSELRDELKAAFVSGRPDDAVERLDENKASLDRMLDEYTKQASRPGVSDSLYRAYKTVGGGGVESEQKSSIQNVDPARLVTARVEEELKNPLTNMLAGDLMQLLLLQTQVMKVEMESALMQMDQLMRANRLNFSLMACFPAALGLYTGTLAMKASLSLSVFRRRQRCREEMRMLLHEAERALTNLKIAERRSVQQGMLIYALNSLYAAVQRNQHLFTRAEWRSARVDVLELADPSISIDNKLVTVARLARTRALIPEPHRIAGSYS